MKKHIFHVASVHGYNNLYKFRGDDPGPYDDKKYDNNLLYIFGNPINVATVARTSQATTVIPTAGTMGP